MKTKTRKKVHQDERKFVAAATARILKGDATRRRLAAEAKMPKRFSGRTAGPNDPRSIAEVDPARNAIFPILPESDLVLIKKGGWEKFKAEVQLDISTKFICGDMVGIKGTGMKAIVGKAGWDGDIRVYQLLVIGEDIL